MFSVSSLKEIQFQALYSFICGEEFFVNLPTGSGKSLIFQMEPLVHMWMHEKGIGNSLEEEYSDHHHQSAFSAYGGPSEEIIFSWI